MEELWVDVPNNEGYQVSNYGCVTYNGVSIPTYVSKTTGRKSVEINGKSKYLHLLVARMFVPNPDHCRSVRFLDDNVRNCSSDNLQWYSIEHGTPSDDAEWRDVVGYEGLYKVSSDGHICKSNGKLMSTGVSTGAGNYLHVGLTKNKYTKYHQVHRLVAEAFLPNPKNKPCVNHIDGDQQNNCVENLEWVTHSENSRHAIETGLHCDFHKKPVRCVETGQTFSSISAASKWLGVDSVSVLVRFGQQKHGYTFEFVESL